MTKVIVIMLITAIVLATASLMLNVYQWAQHRVEKKQTNKLIADSAVLEAEYKHLQGKYDNEVLHKNWAIGRIKDQQAAIDQLKANMELRPKRTFKKGGEHGK
jgi:biopolymer transport protein ExbB/TolQ